MGIKRVRESFAYWDADGNPHDMPAGTLIDSERTSAYKGRESLFEDVDVFVDRQEEKKEGYKSPVSTVETASAAPGEKRTLTSPTKSVTRTTGKDAPKND